MGQRLVRTQCQAGSARIKLSSRRMDMIVRRSIVKGKIQGKEGSSFSEEKEAKRLLFILASSG